jgi:SH3 domain protein
VRRWIVILAAWLVWPTLLLAETAYVTDILRLGLHRADDTSDQPFRNLVSGTELEVLGRTTNFARVRTADGLEGWVKSAYLVLDKPAQLRVSELDGELEALRLEFGREQAARLAAEQQLAQISQQADAVAASSDAVEATLTRLKEQNADYEQRLDQYRGSIPMPWVLGALGVMLLAGFAAGIAWVDYMSRRRHGGFRIY